MSASQTRSPRLPVWAPRIRKEKIARLYRLDARGIVDEALIDEIGIGILARAESILEATAASRGNALCVECRALVTHACRNDQDLLCERCGWTCTWASYKRTYQKKQLHAGGIEDFLREFIRTYPRARTPGEKMVIIDTMIHRYHWEHTKDGVTRPGACNLIEGRLHDIVVFLDELSHGERSTPGTRHTQQAWREKAAEARRRWG
jgi:hypothetical protein